MKIALVFPPFYLPSLYNLPPLGLIQLATVLENVGHRPTIVDLVLDLRIGELPFGPGIYDACADRILAASPDMVGMSAQCTTYPAVIQIARRLRDRAPGMPIVIGGHNAAFADIATLERFDCIDAVVRGEGEETFPALVADLAGGGTGAEVAGVTCRHNGRILKNPDRPLMADLDRLPDADYHHAAPLAAYRDACDLPRAIAIVDVGRGCPHRCVYCSESALWQHRTRVRSVDRVVSEMARLRSDFGAECFLLAYDQFTASPTYVREFCRAVLNRGLADLPWYCISRLDTVDADLLALMRRAGCESMCYGIDSGSQRTLAFIRKRIDTTILFDRVQATTDQGLVPTLSFVIGFPEETREDIDATITLALKTGVLGNSNPLVQMPTVLPGTELHARYADRLVRAVDTYFALGLEFHDGRRLDADEQLINSDPAMFSAFFNPPCPAFDLIRLKAIADVLPVMITLYPKTFLLLGLALDESPSRLFERWLSWLDGHGAPQGGPAETYAHFPGFFESEWTSADSDAWGHVPDLCRYETAAITSGRSGPPPATANAPTPGSQWRPTAASGLEVAEFAWPVAQIVEDLRAGRYAARYERAAPETLVFVHADHRLTVTQINDFGRDVIRLCDGSHPVPRIATLLADQYGPTVPDGDTAAACRNALDAFVDLKWVHPPSATPQPVGRR